MTDTSGTFGGWSDRITYILAEGQLIVAGVAVSIGLALVWFRPSLPGIPPIAGGMFAALLLLGPPLFAVFISGVRKLRTRNWTTVYHINAATDTRQKYLVSPDIWSEKDVDGPSPYRVNENEDFEVREFEYDEELDQLRVRGSHLSQMQDSALVSFRTLAHDLHETFVEKWLDLNALRARDSKRGLQVQDDVINAQAEADERGLMEPQLAVKEAWEDSLEQVKQDDDHLDVDDLESYSERQHASWSPDPVGPDRPPEQAATDGGVDE
ncbi:hypothetical protein ACFQL3_12100 [Natronoarchaeum sp. GCM10025321]|uniref:hypothetical protein n=1 Tax=Natronoarchaeum sp. GCM10025321 TaxID=3252684 RepID=UPI0036135EB7